MSSGIVDPLSGVRIGAIIFDMDGLMFDTERLAVDAWVVAAKLHGYEIDRSFFLRSVGIAAGGTRDLLVQTYGPDFPHDAIRAMRLDIAAAFIANNGVPVKPGLVELLAYLKSEGFPCAVATSTYRVRVDPLLNSAGVIEYFAAVICGDEVTHCKPDPEIYLTAATRLGVPPENCLVLEDSIPGIAAAHAAGMIPAMVPDLLNPDIATLERAICLFPDLLEVRDWLEGMKP